MTISRRFVCFSSHFNALFIFLIIKDAPRCSFPSEINNTQHIILIYFKWRADISSYKGVVGCPWLAFRKLNSKLHNSCKDPTCFNPHLPRQIVASASPFHDILCFFWPTRCRLEPALFLSRILSRLSGVRNTWDSVSHLNEREFFWPSPDQTCVIHGRSQYWRCSSGCGSVDQ